MLRRNFVIQDAYLVQEVQGQIRCHLARSEFDLLEPLLHFLHWLKLLLQLVTDHDMHVFIFGRINVVDGDRGLMLWLATRPATASTVAQRSAIDKRRIGVSPLEGEVPRSCIRIRLG